MVQFGYLVIKGNHMFGWLSKWKTSQQSHKAGASRERSEAIAGYLPCNVEMEFITTSVVRPHLSSNVHIGIEMAAHLLDPACLAGAVRQIITSKDFRAKNQHLSERDYRALLSSPPMWPASPVFSPYAATHGEYSQSELHPHSESRSKDQTDSSSSPNQWY
jgi:hypothetical protein